MKINLKSFSIKDFNENIDVLNLLSLMNPIFSFILINGV